jgi:hypothetical protein
MSKKEKRELKIRENLKSVSLTDFEWLINQYGHIKEGGNHPKAKIGKMTYPYKRENPVKQAYVEGILEIIDNLK